jgi:hypothetical protein
MRSTQFAKSCVVAALLVPAVAAHADDDALSRDVVSCIEAAAGTAGIDPSMVPRLFTRKCSAACPGLAAYPTTDPGGDFWKPLASGCGLFCSDAAMTAFESAKPSRRWLQLATTCGPERYGLPTAQASLMSDVWFVAHTIGDWLARANREAGPKSRLALDDLAKTLPRDRWVLPLPASLPGWYEDLPRAGYGFDSVFAPDYVIVSAHEVSIGAVPEAKLTLQGAKLPTDWPGKVVPLSALKKLQEPFRRPVQPVAGGNRGVLGPPPSVADATINKVRASAPVVLADGSLSAARLVDVVEALGENGARFGVTHSGGDVGEHSVLLTTRPIAIGPVTDHLSLQHFLAPRENRTAKRGVVVWINVQDATVQDLAGEMNRLYAQGVRLVVLDDENEGLTTITRGSLAKDAIRPVITAHLAEIRRCYETGLKWHALYGRVVVQFTISVDGTVVASTTQDSTLDDATVEYCINEAVRTWTFPKPSGGPVVVSYPFVLKMPDKK